MVIEYFISDYHSALKSFLRSDNATPSGSWWSSGGGADDK